MLHDERTLSELKDTVLFFGNDEDLEC